MLLCNVCIIPFDGVIPVAGPYSFAAMEEYLQDVHDMLVGEYDYHEKDAQEWADFLRRVNTKVKYPVKIDKEDLPF